MPTYDYQCAACGHAFELFQSMSAAVKRKCPECGKSKLERLIGKGAAVLFKGSGFYETDYRKESYQKAAKADSAPSTDSKAADSKAADTTAKPDSKPSVEGKPASPAKPAASKKKRDKGSE